MSTDRKTHWLSYGGGVNSTALAVLLCSGRLPQYEPWRVIFADTGDEKDETYSYIRSVMVPYLERHGKRLEVVRGLETVLGRWQRLGVTGSRLVRSCTDHAKIIPITHYIKLNSPPGPDGKPDVSRNVSIIGYAAEEHNRVANASPKLGITEVYPLYGMGIDRAGCEKIIRDAGLCVPTKSGCWHCPFSRKAEVLELARTRPEKIRLIDRLEADAENRFGNRLNQWGNRPALKWLELAHSEAAQGRLFDDEPDPPCGCWDGE